jgi:hypothetical protein
MKTASAVQHLIFSATTNMRHIFRRVFTSPGDATARLISSIGQIPAERSMTTAIAVQFEQL